MHMYLCICGLAHLSGLSNVVVNEMAFQIYNFHFAKLIGNSGPNILANLVDSNLINLRADFLPIS